MDETGKRLTSQTSLLDLIQELLDQELNSSLVDVVAEGDSATGLETLLEVFNTDWHAVRSGMLVVFGVNVGINHVVLEFSHGLGDSVAVGEVWSTHISWSVSINDGSKDIVKLLHLKGNSSRVELREIGMRITVVDVISD